MKANELKIGNLLRRGIQEYAATEYTITCCVMHPDNYSPIPLTEDWLLRFGFEKTDRFFNLNSVLLLKVDECYLFHYSNITDSRSTLKYVHQLQNLYFALTGEELV